MVEKIEILGVGIAKVSLMDLLKIFQQAIQLDQRLFVTHTNVTGLNIAYEQEWYREVLNSSDIVFCDGMGVLLGSRLLGYHLLQRFTLADWIFPLAEMALKNSFSFYFLGNPPGAAARAALKLQGDYAGLQIKGTQHGFFDKTPGQGQNTGVLEEINRQQPDFLLVGFGMPLQEQWLWENWRQLEVKIAITCGALFEYLCGDLKRGPRWMTDHYLEWLARVLVSPRRYGKRYLRDNPLFLYRILKQKFQGRADR